MADWKSDGQLAAELVKLRALQKQVREYNFFGDNNVEAIKAQCSVLAQRMSMDTVHETWGNEHADDFSQHVLDAAIEARDWMTGDLAVDEGAPSDGWVPAEAGPAR